MCKACGGGLGLSVILLCSLQAACAQEPVAIEAREAWDHRVGPFGLIHSESGAPPFGLNQIALEVIVSASGNVEFARAISGPAEFFGAAEKAEGTQKFKPFKRNGQAMRASFTDYVNAVPPEKWAEPGAPFPAIKNWSSLRIRLERTACYGDCPAYSVEVGGNGSVDFDGTNNVLIAKHHHSTISKQTIADLVAAFHQAHYFSLKDDYVYGVTDNPSYTTSIEFDETKKSVHDYACLQAGMPVAARDVEDAIDRLAGTEKWIKGNGGTGAALSAEKWNFEADAEENRALLATVVAHGSSDLVQLFLAHGAPALGMTEEGQAGLVSAAGKRNLELVKLMLADQPKPETAVLSCALGEAARSGSLSLVQLLLNKGGDANGAPCGAYVKLTVLMKAAGSVHAEIVEEILKHHPDVNARDVRGMTALDYFFAQTAAKTRTPATLRLMLAAKADTNSRDDSGRTPLYDACAAEDPEAIGVLAAAGADLNAKDQVGQTVFMSCFGNAGLDALIAAGADLTIRNKRGQTAAEDAR